MQALDTTDEGHEMSTAATENASAVTIPGQTDMGDMWPDVAADESAPDDAAPYGRKLDGTPKKAPGRPRSPRKNAAGPKPPPAPPRRPSTKSARKPAVSPYKAAVAGPLQAVGMVLAVTAQQTGNGPLLADAQAIAKHTDAVSTALADIADNDPRVAAVLERLAQVGPWGALVGAMMPLVLQLAANHGAPVLGLGGVFGVVHPATLLEEALAEQQAMNAALADFMAGGNAEPADGAGRED